MKPISDRSSVSASSACIRTAVADMYRVRSSLELDSLPARPVSLAASSTGTGLELEAAAQVREGPSIEIDGMAGDGEEAPFSSSLLLGWGATVTLTAHPTLHRGELYS